jgi:hypothetical protein
VPLRVLTVYASERGMEPQPQLQPALHTSRSCSTGSCPWAYLHSVRPQTAAVSIVRPSRGGASVPQGLEYSQSLNERNTFYFNRSTAGPSSGPSDPKMMPTVLELPPPSLEATSMASSSRFAQYSASAPAAPTIGR